MVTLQKALHSALTFTVVLFIGLVSLAYAQGEKDSSMEHALAKKNWPAAVLSAFQKQYPDARIKGVSKEVEDSIVYYEIESADSSANRTVLYTGDGRLTEIEEVISSKQLPDSAQALISKDYPKGKVEAAEKVTKGSVITYEVKIKNGEANIEVVFNSTGKKINAEKVKGEEDID